MARGKYAVSKKNEAQVPPGEVTRGVGPFPLTAAVHAGPVTASSTTEQDRAAGRADRPLLGVAVTSPWGWRVLAVFTLLAIGLCITFLLDGHTFIGAMWVVIALGWGSFTLRLWRLHLDWDRSP